MRARYCWDGLGRLSAVERDGGRTELDVDAFGSLAAVNGVELTWDRPRRCPSSCASVNADGGTARSAGGDRRRRRVLAARRRLARLGGHLRPVGAPAAAGADAPLGLGYAGELSVGGLVWLRNRAYGPATRQFLSADPQSGLAGTPFARNPYHYAGNDPIGQVDPLGLAPVSLEQYRALKAEARSPVGQHRPARAHRRVVLHPRRPPHRHGRRGRHRCCARDHPGHHHR